LGFAEAPRVTTIAKRRRATTSFRVERVSPAHNLQPIEQEQSFFAMRCLDVVGSLVGGKRSEDTMATKQHGQIIETPTEARQGERGPSVLALLVISTGLAIVILGMIWFVFIRG
jgi:hypothetical protein